MGRSGHASTTALKSGSQGVFSGVRAQPGAQLPPSSVGGVVCLHGFTSPERLPVEQDVAGSSPAVGSVFSRLDRRSPLCCRPVHTLPFQGRFRSPCGMMPLDGAKRDGCRQPHAPPAPPSVPVDARQIRLAAEAHRIRLTQVRSGVAVGRVPRTPKIPGCQNQRGADRGIQRADK